MAVSKTCGVYKYVHKKLGVIYVGHSAMSVETRIRAHKSEAAFAPYLDDCCVYICSLPNKSVAIAMELLLIDHYRPVLNTYSKEDWPYTGTLPELNWMPYLSWRDTASAAKEAKGMKSIRLKELRMEAGLTQQELADRLGISKQAVSMYELGNRRPAFDIAEAIASFFGVSIRYLSGSAENTADEIGRRIADQRKKIGMTQEELGRLTGYTVGGISGIEAGRRSFGVEKLADFATALHVAPGELLII
mgnify:CR=1 FL=1